MAGPGLGTGATAGVREPEPGAVVGVDEHRHLVPSPNGYAGLRLLAVNGGPQTTPEGAAFDHERPKAAAKERRARGPDLRPHEIRNLNGRAGAGGGGGGARLFEPSASPEADRAGEAGGEDDDEGDGGPEALVAWHRLRLRGGPCPSLHASLQMCNDVMR